MKILGVVRCFFVVFVMLGDFKCHASGTLPITDGKTILQLYQLMKDVNDVLDFKNIEYWVLAGTLLGAVRHQGIIPWDDDLDICVNKKEFERVFSLKPIFEQLGYEVVPWGSGYKVFPINGIKVYSQIENGIEKYFKFPFLDVFFYEQKGNNIIYGWDQFKQPRKDKNVAIYADELFPIKSYKFGSFFVKGPNQPLNYLACGYGDDCLNVGVYDHGHGVSAVACADPVSMNQESKAPAMPTGPLNDDALSLFKCMVSLETVSVSNENLNEARIILEKLCPIYIEAFKEEAETQLKKEHLKNYRELRCKGLTIKDVLLARFNKMVDVFIQRIRRVKGSYITILKNDKAEIIGYNIFNKAPINQIINSMIRRKYVKSVVSLSEEISTHKNSDDDLYILSVAVHPSYQKMGLGKKLIFALLDQRFDAKNIYLLTAASTTNIEVQEFYEHLNFERAGLLLTADNNQKILYSLNKSNLALDKR